MNMISVMLTAWNRMADDLPSCVEDTLSEMDAILK